MMWIKALPWGVAALMAFAAAFCLHLYQSERDAFVAFRAEVKAIGEAQQAQVEKDKQQAEENLRQVRKDYEDRIPDIRDAAVRAYRLRYPNTCSGAVPGNAASVQVDDGAGKEPVADEFVRACAEDAAKLSAFQDYCKRNNCPVKE
jgi:type IV secretory pathway TrbF-like protein